MSWLPRLVLVEFRKSLDTRSGRSLIAVGVVVVIALSLTASSATATSHPQIVSIESAITLAAAPLFVLAPLIALVSFTSEWTTKTAQTTFTLTPRRTRVLLAKAISQLGVAVCLLLVAAVVATVVSAIVAILASAQINAVPIDIARTLASSLIQIVLITSFGMTLGALIPSTALASIVFLIFTATIDGIISAAVPAVAPWLQFTNTITVIAEFDIIPAQIAPMIVAATIWLILPTAIATLRFIKRDA